MRRGVDVAVGLLDSAFFGAPEAAGGLNRDAQRCSRRRTRWTGRWFALMGRTPGNFIAPGVELETRSIGQRSVTALHSFVIALQRPKIFRAEPSVCDWNRILSAVGAETQACEFVRSKSLWRLADSRVPACGFAADKLGIQLWRARRPIRACTGDLIFQTAAMAQTWLCDLAAGCARR
jgi:hypothetical protein